MVFLGFPLCRHYVMCGKKMASLGWKENTPWEEGLKKTIDWFTNCQIEHYFECGDIDTALQPHPTAVTEIGGFPRNQMLPIL